ncbi:hypothetical protein [Deinococcus sp. QL22]|uniref:hypothetical protein n=1 Tax=Deinococcus sp. QL22 TaxID=2939437 RepID=UPI0020179744|nr:hypothetical protein [Deinococcus sp. QL22]UQN10125.1 hypothetical protein M1R55_28470 [Deinococcus sp. QL22]UQN10141.1 hypothetical protein M1R55_28555 [Deinococcus sp. QL22]
MHPRDLTPAELADLLDDAYREDRGLGTAGLEAKVRLELADHLGCHPELQAQVWEVWQEMLILEGDVEEGDALFWLDVEFVEPCPEQS